MTLPTARQVRDVYDYDPETGVFTWKADRVTSSGKVVHLAGDVAGSIQFKGYWVVTIGGKQYLAHRVAWLYVTGQWPAQNIDHKNGWKMDNSWANLRDVSPLVNSQNRQGAQKNSATGLLGASWNRLKCKFTARLKVNGRYLSLGYHDTAEAAHAAYVAAKRQHHAGCTI
jgi:hypothetical protein